MSQVRLLLFPQGVIQTYFLTTNVGRRVWLWKHLFLNTTLTSYSCHRNLYEYEGFHLHRVTVHYIGCYPKRLPQGLLRTPIHLFYTEGPVWRVNFMCGFVVFTTDVLTLRFRNASSLRHLVGRTGTIVQGHLPHRCSKDEEFFSSGH